jgi:hypothetical protein
LSNKFFISLAIITLSGINAIAQAAHHWETIIKADDSWKYMVPASEFDATAWNEGQGGFGYGDNDDKTIVASGTTCIYIRKTFEVADTSKITAMILNADYDDAFVAYINGKEVARGGGLLPAIPAYNNLASYTHEALMYTNGNPESYLITKTSLRSFLKNGTNALCIQVYNDVSTSSDFSGIFFLSAGIRDESILYNPTPSWFQAPVEAGISNLPIVSINTNGVSIGDEPKTPATIKFIDNGKGQINRITDTPVLECRIGIETRGSMSQTVPKKSYGFETRTAKDSNLNVPVLGLPADNDWILYAPYNDKTFMRDVLAYRLSRQMGHYASRFVPCELYLNGNYEGVYILLEKIKQGANRVNIANLKTTDISGKDLSGGYIFKIDKTTGSNNAGWTSPYHPKQLSDRYINFLYHYPKVEDITNEQKSYIKFFVTSFENALASNSYLDAVSGYKKFIDVNSFVDYFIINEVSKNIDGYRISSFFHKDREDRGNKIVAGPIWDYNLAFGNADYYNGYSASGWVINSIPNSDDYQVPFWWQRFLTDPEFLVQLKQRYTQLRSGVLKLDSINNFIDSMALVFKEPQARNFQKWPILGTYVWPNYYIGSTYQQEIGYMKDWIDNRLKWVDSNWLILATPTSNSHIVSNTAVIYPNPFSTNLYVEIFPDKVSKSALIELYDLTGKSLFRNEIAVDKSEKTTWSLTENWQPAATLAPGIYILKIRLASGKTFQCKIIKD